MNIRSEVQATYDTPILKQTPPHHDDEVIENALQILRKRLAYPGTALTSPELVRKYLRLQLADLQDEQFSLLLLDNRNQVLGFETLFTGTIDSASVYPRGVVKTVLQYNAAAVILAHNHPSGNTSPSPADIRLTKNLKAVLETIEVRVLDHLIVGGDAHLDIASFAEQGLL